MKKKDKTILVNGEKVKFIPATEFNATYHWQKTNKTGTHIPDHIWDRYEAKRMKRERLEKLKKKNKDEF
tara:strand:- start:688 stop:894 length:207 start_codon:yes stop_codon:yes gene_type:complete